MNTTECIQVLGLHNKDLCFIEPKGVPVEQLGWNKQTRDLIWAFANFRGVNIPAMTDFELEVYQLALRIPAYLTISPPEPKKGVSFEHCMEPTLYGEKTEEAQG